jgi:hypothetical protein
VVATPVRAHARPLVPVLHPRYKVVGHQGVTSTPDGRYTLFPTRPSTVGTVFNERTGRRRVVVLPRSCRAPSTLSNVQLGDNWLAAQCSRSRAALYSLATGRWRSLNATDLCRPAASNGCSLDAVGTDWLEYDNGNDHVGDRFVFEKIATGAVRSDPTHANTDPHVWADLDSPQLGHRICAPLRVPKYGSVQFTGQFAIATTSSGTQYLERCGTGLHRLLSEINPVGVGAHAILFYNDPNGPQIGRLHPVSGLVLPSLKAFKLAPPPVARGEISWVDLTDRHIYVTTDTGGDGEDVWSAPTTALARATVASATR